MVYVAILLPVFIIVALLVISSWPESNSTNRPVPAPRTRSNAGAVVVGALVATAAVAITAWRVEGAVLNRSILRNRARVSKKRASLWY